MTFIFYKNFHLELSMVAQVCDPSTWEVVVILGFT